MTLDIIAWQSDGPAYVAIYHVWADGIGNPDQNLSLECQLVKISHHFRNALHDA